MNYTCKKWITQVKMNYTRKKWITLVKNDVLQYSSAFFTSKNPETIQLWLGPNEENADSQKCDSLIGQFFSNLSKVHFCNLVFLWPVAKALDF